MIQRRQKGMSIFVRLLSAFVGVTVVICGLSLLTLYVFSKKTIEAHTAESVAQQLAAMQASFMRQYGGNLTRDLRTLSSHH